MLAQREFSTLTVDAVEARAHLHSVTANKFLLPSTDTATVGWRGFLYLELFATLHDRYVNVIVVQF